MKKKIIWNENGWTTVQEADAAKHILEISAYAENGYVVEVRKRHNHGEEEVIKKKLDADHALPMPFDDFRELVSGGMISFK